MGGLRARLACVLLPSVVFNATDALVGWGTILSRVESGGRGRLAGCLLRAVWVRWVGGWGRGGRHGGGSHLSGLGATKSTAEFGFRLGFSSINSIQL